MTAVTQKRREKKGIFSSTTGPFHNFFTSARHDEPGELIKSTLVKSTPKWTPFLLKRHPEGEKNPPLKTTVWMIYMWNNSHKCISRWSSYSWRRGCQVHSLQPLYWFFDHPHHPLNFLGKVFLSTSSAIFVHHSSYIFIIAHIFSSNLICFHQSSYIFIKAHIFSS